MFLENIKEAIISLFSNKMRSLLTMLGIIIGIGAVITITTIGSSIKSTLNATLNSLGGNSIQMYLEARYPEDDAGWENWEYPDMKEEDYITREMLDELQETYPDDISGYANEVNVGSGQVWESKDRYANVTISGVSLGYLEYLKLDIIKGRGITEVDDEKEKRVCIISEVMAENYFGKTNPIGELINVNMMDGSSYEYAIVGVYEYNEAIFGKQDTTIPVKDRMTAMFIPENTALGLSSEDSAPGYSNVTVTLKNTSDIESMTADILEFFNEKYENNKNWNVHVYNMASELGTINTVISAITVAISFIAAISLIVGGVGVMNIMLVTITERTKEIGIRKALGAKNKDISQQFLIESVVLCLIGGIIGILAGIGLGLIIGEIVTFVINNYYAEYQSYIIMSVHPSVLAIILSVAFSMLIGIFFGSYPAKKAAKMEVIDALRYE